VSAVTLRPSEPGDLDAMLSVVAACDETWREWAPPDWEPPTPASMRWVSHLGAPDRWTRVAVEPGGTIVGLISWGPARGGEAWLPVEGTAHIGALFVHPDHWRTGVATELHDAALAAMRADGYVRARLNTPAGAPAERFYAARGWARGDGVRWHEVARLDSVQYTIDL
jgi:GNAT superfamily N-acetyltransferase